MNGPSLGEHRLDRLCKGVVELCPESTLLSEVLRLVVLLRGHFWDTYYLNMLDELLHIFHARTASRVIFEAFIDQIVEEVVQLAWTILKVFFSFPFFVPDILLHFIVIFTGEGATACEQLVYDAAYMNQVGSSHIAPCYVWLLM